MIVYGVVSMDQTRPLIHANPCSIMLIRAHRPRALPLSASCPSTTRRNLHHLARSSSSSETARTQEARHLPRLRRQPYGCASGSRRASRTTISNLYGMFYIDEYLSTWISLSGNAGGRKRLVAEIIKAASARCGHPRVGRSPPRGGQAAPPEHTRKEEPRSYRRLLPTFPTSSEGVTNPRC